MLKLNVGCGQYRAPAEWINIDHPSAEFDPAINADIYCQAQDLPFLNGTVSRIYMGHVIEHLDSDEIGDVLVEFFRVLEPDGQLMVVSPDQDRIDLMPLVPPWLREAMRTDNEGREGEHHKWVPTEDEVLSRLEDEGWDACVVDLSRIKADGWPLVSYSEWQFAVLAKV